MSDLTNVRRKWVIYIVEIVKINSEFITLGQLLKLENIVESGGMAKTFLADYKILINEQQDQRRGRKLYSGDVVQIEAVGKFKIMT